VILFHYTTWPDFGVPQSPTALLRFIRAVRKSGALDENMGPPIVHCSAGIGRSGTFILVDCVLKLVIIMSCFETNINEYLHMSFNSQWGQLGITLGLHFRGPGFNSHLFI
jgi:Protein tyrosine phosphatase